LTLLLSPTPVADTVAVAAPVADAVAARRWRDRRAAE